MSGATESFGTWRCSGKLRHLAVQRKASRWAPSGRASWGGGRGAFVTGGASEGACNFWTLPGGAKPRRSCLLGRWVRGVRNGTQAPPLPVRWKLHRLCIGFYQSKPQALVGERLGAPEETIPFAQTSPITLQPRQRSYPKPSPWDGEGVNAL